MGVKIEQIGSIGRTGTITGFRISFFRRLVAIALPNIALVTMGASVFAAPAALNKKPANNRPKFSEHSWLKQVDQVKAALALPIPNRYEVLLAQGPLSFPVLEFLAFDETHSFKWQWNAITAFAQLRKAKATKLIEKALKSPKWYHRNAALLGIHHCDPTKAFQWSLRLLKDPSLFVRTSAVQSLIRINRRGAAITLWEELYSKQNYRGAQSLWVRKYIAKALSNFAVAGEKKRFLKMLRDKDERLHPFAIKGLERSTGRIIGRGQAMNKKRKIWLSSL